MVNKTGLSHFPELYKHLEKTEMYHLYRVSNSFFSVALMLGNLPYLRWVSMESEEMILCTVLDSETRREAGKLYI